MVRSPLPYPSPPLPPPTTTIKFHPVTNCWLFYYTAAAAAAEASSSGHVNLSTMEAASCGPTSAAYSVRMGASMA